MPIFFRSNLSHSSKYRADVDGLRALAVLSVICFHAKILGCHGGFVGVDVFFVISGYLITSLIAKDIAAMRFSVVSFYERRMRRIFPALFGVLFFCIFAAALLFVPRDLLAFAKSLVATTFFISNLYFWRHAPQLGYFADTSNTQTLLHTWSLSVEEQYYLLFPALLLLLFRWARKWFNPCMWTLAVFSFSINIWATMHRPTAAFYLLVPRAWELLMGALLATKGVPPLHNRIAREIAGVLGLALVLVAVFGLSETTPFPGFSALLPCLGASLIIYAGEYDACWTKTLLSLRPLVFIGTISYSLYLWHWPLLVFCRYFSAGELTPAKTAQVLVWSAVIAFLSFKFVERPFRGSNSAFSRRQIFAFGFAASLTSAVLGFGVYLSHGIPQRYDQRTLQLVQKNINEMNDYIEICGNWKTEVHSVADINFCRLGNSSSRKIMFWGDSHVGQLFPLIRVMYNQGVLRDEGVLFAIADGCLPAKHLNTVGDGYHCDSFAKFAIARAEESDIDTVFIGFNTWWSHEDGIRCVAVDGKCKKSLSRSEAGRLFLEELVDHIRILRSLRKRVIVCLPFPMYDKSIPELEMRNAIFGRFGLSGIATDVTSPALRQQLRSIANTEGAEIFDPRLSLCGERNCIIQVNGISIYTDSQHIAASETEVLRNNLQDVLHLQSAGTVSE